MTTYAGKAISMDVFMMAWGRAVAERWWSLGELGWGREGWETRACEVLGS